MSEKVNRLRRLLTIRRVEEDRARRHLQHTLASVAEVETALEQQRNAITAAAEMSVAALTQADRSAWILAEAQSEIAGWNCARLGAMLPPRKKEIAPAMDAFLVSRRAQEQVKILVDSARKELQIDQDRKAQAAADDWALGKRLARRSDG